MFVGIHPSRFWFWHRDLQPVAFSLTCLAEGGKGEGGGGGGRSVCMGEGTEGGSNPFLCTCRYRGR